MANKNSSSSKNLTLSSLKKKNKVYSETFDINVDGFTVSINKKWSPNKINDLIVEFVDTFDKELKANNAFSISSSYLSLLFLRYFTSLTIPKDLTSQLEWLEQLIDSGYLTQIVNQLPQDQMEIAQKQLQDAKDNLIKNLPLIEEEVQKLDLKNEEVINMINPQQE